MLENATATAPLLVFDSVLQMIGRTPMLEARNLDTGPCRLFLKLELANPAGSIKDRIGLSMIEAAEREGLIDPGADPKPTLVEGTAGNTGLGLALVAGQRGYRLIVVVPDKMAKGKIQHLRAMGAQVVLTRSDVEKGHPDYYQDVAERIANETPNAIYINQFGNEHNPEAHYEHTGPEMLEQMLQATGAPPDAFIVGVGSGGTLSGVGAYFKEKCPDTEIILADPAGSILAPLVNEGKKVDPGAWLVEGMGEDFVPPICHLDLVTRAIAVSDADAFLGARALLKAEGLLAGSSTGCLIHAALQYCKAQTEPKNVVTFVCDTGTKYLDKVFSDEWMIDAGFIKRETYGDLRDLISRRHLEREDYVLKPGEPVQQAIKTMKLHDISQLPVVDPADPDRVVGIIDESDILMAVTHDKQAWRKPVSDFMTSRLETIPHTSSVNDLMPIFRADRVAIVNDEEGRFLGLITRIDLINMLRRQVH
jgi:cystathionine beta-synthase